MTERRRVLVFEYLLADTQAWVSASDSMRSEAAAMLIAVVDDLRQISDVTPVVLVSREAAAGLQIALQPEGDTEPVMAELLIAEQSPQQWLTHPSMTPSGFHASLVIAPECDGILTSLLKLLQSGEWKSVAGLNVSVSLAERFSDKLQTYHWLRQHQIKTPRTVSVSDASAHRLKQLRVSSESATTESCRMFVLKPRDGAGSGEVLTISLTGAEFESLAEFESPDDPWILQPYLVGQACSVGLIGTGAAESVLVLPAAIQEIQNCDGRLCYRGGRIPCTDLLATAISGIAGQVSHSLEGFRGYLGIDVVVSMDADGLHTAHLIEVNPRLCTSYVGYRAILSVNLAEWMLKPQNNNTILLRRNAVMFDASGRVTFA